MTFSFTCCPFCLRQLFITSSVKIFLESMPPVVYCLNHREIEGSPNQRKDGPDLRLAQPGWETGKREGWSDGSCHGWLPRLAQMPAKVYSSCEDLAVKINY
jgi:hypothetical protein